MKTHHDFIIIGAGPAGLQLGYFLAKNHRDYLILEKSDSPGAFFSEFPRHRMLISINKVNTGKSNPEINLRWDWNSLLGDSEQLKFKNYSKRYFPHPDDLRKYLADYAHHYDLNIKYDTRIVNIHKEHELFVVADDQGNMFTAHWLVVATGVTKAYYPDIPGVELCDTYADHSISPEEYRDMRVLVVGKGNSGFETAENLTETAAVIHVLSPHSLKFAWETHFVGNLRAVNNNLLDTYQLKSQNTVIDASITKIEKMDDKYYVHIVYSHAKGQSKILVYDRVILCTGFRFDDSIFDVSCRPQLNFNGKFPEQTHEWESVNVPGMYFAGTLMQACDYKKTMSGFIHGFRYNVRALSNIFEEKYFGNPWPYQKLDATPAAIHAKIFERLNNASGIFLQPGFMKDAVVIMDDENTARYYEDIRSDYIDQEYKQYSHYYTIGLEYGHAMMTNPFSVERDPDPFKGNESSYLHPIIRRYKHGVLVSEHHVNDDLENEWYLPEYVDPAMSYFNAELVPNQEVETAQG